MERNDNPFDQIAEQIKELRNLITQNKTQSEKPKEQVVDAGYLFSCAEVLTLFKTTRPTLRRWEKSGRLKPVRIGRKLLFRSSDIHDLLSSDLKNGGRI